MASLCKLNLFATTILLVAYQLSIASAKQIGVCYGLNGNNLPAPSDVIRLYKSCGIKMLRIYEPNPQVLEALRGSGLAVSVGPRNEELEGLSSNPEQANSWVATNIAPYKSNVNFRWITLGNEVIPGPLGTYVAGAMANIKNSLVSIGLPHVFVTTTVPGNALSASYPPSSGVFTSEITGIMTDVARQLAQTGSPLMLNVYPYFAYAADPGQISLDFALFKSTAPVFSDGGLEYYNLFDAMVDAFNAALEKIGYANVAIAISESGWPSAGNEPFTSVANAQTYNLNLLNHVTKNGTPRKPTQLMNTFHFAMFNENLKAPGVEQNFGLFKPDMRPVYPYCSF